MWKKVSAGIFLAFILVSQISYFPPRGGGGGGGGYGAGYGLAVNGANLDVNSAVIAALDNVQNEESKICRSTTGNDAYTCTINPTPTLGDGTTGSLCVLLTTDFASSGASSLDVNGIGVKALQNPDGTDATVLANKPAHFCYDGTQFVFQGGGGSSGTAIPAMMWATGPMASANGTVTAGANHRVTYYTFSVPSPGITVTSYAFYALAGTGTIGFAILDAATCTVQANSAATVNAPGTNARRLSTPGTVTLTPGQYYIAWTSTVGTDSLYRAVGDFYGQIMNYSSSPPTLLTGAALAYFTSDVQSISGVIQNGCGTRTATVDGASPAAIGLKGY